MLSALPSVTIVLSEWLWMSMKPGATISPAASMTFVAGRPFRFPISVIFPPVMPTSAMRQGLPVPSTSLPPRMRTSNCCGNAASPKEETEASGAFGRFMPPAISCSV